MKRPLVIASRTVGAIIGIALLAGGALLGWVAGTESGLQFVWQRVASRLPEGVEIEALEGRLGGPLVISGAVLRTPALELRVRARGARVAAARAARRNFAIDRLRRARRGRRPVAARGRAACTRSRPRRCPRASTSRSTSRSRALRSKSCATARSPEAEALLIERVDLEATTDRRAMADPQACRARPAVRRDGATADSRRTTPTKQKDNSTGCCGSEIIPT